MKFDVILANPPYDNGLHEKFSIKYFDICDGEICWVSPLSFLLGKKQNKKLTVHLDKYATDIEQINGNEYFDAAIGGTMGIVYVDMSDKYLHYVKFDGKEYNKCSEITTYSNDELLTEFKNIIEPLYTRKNIESIIGLDHKVLPNSGVNRLLELNPNPEWWCMGIQIIRGHKDNTVSEVKDDFYTIISNNPDVIKRKVGIYKDMHEEEIPNRTVKNNQKFDFQLYIHADSLNELNSIKNYLETDFCRACIRLVKTGSSLVNGVLRNIPWFDFSNPIFSKSPSEIDDYLFDKFNISDEIRQHIEELLPDYYGIRKGQD